MFAQLLTAPYAPFAVAFLVMLGVGLIELLGVEIGHGDADLDHGVDGSLDWIGLVAEMPLLVWLISLLACFTVSGLALQQIAGAVTGAPLHWLLASLIALVVALILNAFVSRGLVKILPGYESSIISSDELIMRRGTVLEGVARRGHPARAKVVDRHSQAHYVMVEPHEDSDRIGQGETALLVRREGTTFFVLPDRETTFKPL